MIVRAFIFASLFAGGAGCISVPDGPKKMCDSTSDCDHAHGEVCDDGVCYGNPPAGPFAAVISPPSTRHDLVPRELASVDISPDGRIADLQLASPVVYSGKLVQSCAAPAANCSPTAALAGTITLARSSQFHGGPGFQTVVNVASGASFAIPLPPTNTGDDPYTVTVVPDTAHQQAGVPPRRLQVALPAGATPTPPAPTIELGGANLPVISGNLVDPLGQGLANYRVAAIGRWDPTEPTAEVSSVAITDPTGAYTITLSADLAGAVELVAQPPDGVVGPTIHLTNLDASKSTTHSVTEPSALGAPFDVSIDVSGVDLSGTVSSITGATVTLTGALSQGSTTFAFNQQVVTGQSGLATFHVLSGTGFAASYKVSITPPPGSTLGAVFAQPLTLPPVSGKSVAMRLASRLAVQGMIVDDKGKPLSNVAVTARPSLRFLWTLPPEAQPFVASVPAPTAVTQDGQFVLWVDANVDHVWGEYDLVIEPPTTEDAPTFVDTVELLRDNTVTTMALGAIQLPDAAFVHGQITDPTGAPVDSAEIKLYLVSTELQLCSQVANAPTSCPIPASLLGRSTASDRGNVQLALPR